MDRWLVTLVAVIAAMIAAQFALKRSRLSLATQKVLAIAIAFAVAFGVSMVDGDRGASAQTWLFLFVPAAAVLALVVWLASPRDRRQ